MFHSTMIMVAIALSAAPVGGVEQVPEAAARARPVQPPDCGVCSRDLQAVGAEIERHLQTMRTTRLTLAAQTSVLDERIRQQEVFSDHSRQVAEQIRMGYQQARPQQEAQRHRHDLALKINAAGNPRGDGANRPRGGRRATDRLPAAHSAGRSFVNGSDPAPRQEAVSAVLIHANASRRQQPGGTMSSETSAFIRVHQRSLLAP
jgi:hypothetical protein